jgi:predicted esterase
MQKKFTFIWLALILIMAVSPLLADWQSDLDKLLVTEDEKEQKKLIDKILLANPTIDTVRSYIKNLEFPEKPVGELTLRTNKCIDGVERPWVLYVPETYDPKMPTPMIVILHGLVSRKNVMENPIQYAEDHPMLEYIAKEAGWLAIFPMGQQGATWWDEVGMTNIKDLIRTVKREYNVDDNRVNLAGFSDGASGAYGFAMLDPTDFASFVCLNGHPGVPNEDGGLHTYASNLKNAAIFTAFTNQDALYPTSTMSPAVNLMQRAHATLKYRALQGEHTLSAYKPRDFKHMIGFMNDNPRQPHSKFIWETADTNFGQFQWFEIREIDPGAPAMWHNVLNTNLMDSTISIGFIPDGSYEGPGVKVESLAEGQTFAKSIGLKPGDIIMGGNLMNIMTMKDLSRFKSQLHRGGGAVLTIDRNGDKFTAYGTFPPPKKKALFTYKKYSAMARVNKEGNGIEIEGSRLGAYDIKILPEMFDLDMRIVVRHNSEKIFDQHVLPDLIYMLHNFLENRDRELLYVGEVGVDL